MQALRWIAGLSVIALLMAWLWLAFVESAPPALPAVPSTVGERPSVPPVAALPDHERLAVDPASTIAALPELPADQRWLRVRVVDALGDAVAAASVQLQSAKTVAPFEVGQSDAEGRYRRAVGGQVVFVRATHPDVGRSILSDIATSDEVRLVLVRPVTVLGRVLDKEARPFGGARVEIEGNLVSHRQAPGSCLPRDHVVTDAAGRFWFEAAADMRGTARVVDPAWPEAWRNFVAREGTEVLLTEAGALRIEGVVHDEEGRPAAQALLLLFPDAATAPATDVSIVTSAHSDDAGRFELPVSMPGDYRLVTSHKVDDVAYGAEHSVQISAEQPRVVLDVRMAAIDMQSQARQEPEPSPEPASPEILLEMLLVDGSPATQPQLTWLRRNRDGVLRGSVTQNIEDHHHVLARDAILTSPSRLVVVDQKTRQTGSLEFESDQCSATVRLVLQPPGSLQVTVKHRGLPARGIEVELDPCGLPQRARVDSAGIATFSMLPVGPAEIRVLRGAEVLERRRIEGLSGQSLQQTFLVDLSR